MRRFLARLNFMCLFKYKALSGSTIHIFEIKDFSILICELFIIDILLHFKYKQNTSRNI